MMRIAMVLAVFALTACAIPEPKPEPYGPTVSAAQFCTRDGYIAVREKKKNGFVIITMTNQRCKGAKPPPAVKERAV